MAGGVAGIRGSDAPLSGDGLSGPGRDARAGMRRTLACAAVVALLGGCGPLSGSPESVRNTEEDIAALRPVFSTSEVVACVQKVDVADARDCRNRIVQAQMMATDLRYHRFERDFIATSRGGRLLTQLSVLGLTTTAGAAGIAAGTTQALSLIAGGLTGGLALAERELLAERTAIAIHVQMRAGRDRVALRIRDGLNQPVSAYSLSFALRDLDAYAHAGTVPGAIAGLTEQASTDARQASRDLVQGRGVSTLPAARALQAYITDSAVTPEQRVARQEEIEAAASALGYGAVAAPSFADDTSPGAPARQLAVARRLRLMR